MTAQTFDSTKAEAFAERILGMMNGSALALMTSIGHRTELFDTLAELPPSTSQQIADAAGLNERYVREWLGAMVTGGRMRRLPTPISAEVTCFFFTSLPVTRAPRRMSRPPRSTSNTR